MDMGVTYPGVFGVGARAPKAPTRATIPRRRPEGAARCGFEVNSIPFNGAKDSYDHRKDYAVPE